MTFEKNKYKEKIRGQFGNHEKGRYFDLRTTWKRETKEIKCGLTYCKIIKYYKIYDMAYCDWRA